MNFLKQNFKYFHSKYYASQIFWFFIIALDIYVNQFLCWCFFVFRRRSDVDSAGNVMKQLCINYFLLSKCMSVCLPGFETVTICWRDEDRLLLTIWMVNECSLISFVGSLPLNLKNNFQGNGASHLAASMASRYFCNRLMWLEEPCFLMIIIFYFTKFSLDPTRLGYPKVGRRATK